METLTFSSVQMIVALVLGMLLGGTLVMVFLSMLIVGKRADQEEAGVLLDQKIEVFDKQAQRIADLENFISTWSYECYLITESSRRSFRKSAQRILENRE